MLNNLQDWLVSPATAVVFCAGCGYVFRNAIARYFTKSIEHKFDEKLARAKAQFQAKEGEIERISAFIASQKKKIGKHCSLQKDCMLVKAL